MSELRIFSYLPNPRIWKATIAARLCGVEVEVRGASPRELQSWLWDFEAHPLSDDDRASADNLRAGKVGFQSALHKTDAFLDAHPFGTVPAAFSPDGKTGIFESNSIMRAVARLGADRCALYGRDGYEASRIDSFLDASLVFARDMQIYLLAFGGDGPSSEIHARTRDAFAAYAGGINRALAPNRGFLVGDDVTIADICFVEEFSLFMNEKSRGNVLASKGLKPILHSEIDREYPLAFAHFKSLSAHPAFAPDVQPYLKKIAAITDP